VAAVPSPIQPATCARRASQNALPGGDTPLRLASWPSRDAVVADWLACYHTVFADPVKSEPAAEEFLRDP